MKMILGKVMALNMVVCLFLLESYPGRMAWVFE